MAKPQAAIREARDGEEAVLAEIERVTSLAAYRHIFPPEEYPYPQQAAVERWRAAVGSTASVFVAELDGAPVGVVISRPPQVEGLFVLPEHWGSGIADRLHDEAVGYIKRSGGKTASLLVMEANLRARRFYERHGWRPDGRITRSRFPPHPVVLGYHLAL